MKFKWQGICLSAVLLGTMATVGHAQTSASPEDEYKKLIRVNEDIQPLGENPFGENISLYSGALSFEQTDVSLAGNGPTLSISRTFTLNTQPELLQKLQETAFGDWDINLPRITTVAAIQNNVQGWVVANGNPYALCTQFGPPPSVNPPVGDSARNPWDASDWWSGYQLVVPGVGSQDLLLRSAQNTLAPQISGMNFPIVTKQNWAIGCLPHAANDANREAFLAISPDGTQYTLDHLAYRWMPKLDRSLHTLSGPGAIGFAMGPKPMLQTSDTLAREQASMLVTQIKDRFGNTLAFSYDTSNRLTGIVASDGRSVSVSYNGAVSRISSITLQPSNAVPRTWSYQYAVAGLNPTLTQVTLPDLSSWHYDLANLSYGAWVDTRTSVDPQSCSALITPTNLDAVFTGSITHPSGLTGTFTLKPLKRGRSYVNQSCWSGAPNVPTTQGFAVIPDAWYAMVITSKQFVGAGLTTQTWNYGYSPANQSWAQDCATDTSCPKTVTTDVADPNGNATRYTFSNYYDISESQLLQTDFYTGGASGAPLRSEANTYEYVHTATDLYPTQIGANPQPRINAAQTEQLFPLNKRVISQDGGDTYTWQGEGFDAFGAVTQTKRFSSIAGQGAIEEQTSYLNDLPHWVLGLPQQVINLTTGETESVNTYDLTNVTLQSRARFGQTLMQYTFNSAGQLASFTDGNSHTTGLSNYKRGIPQTISYPDATSESLTIDDFSQISAITDQAGHTTNYGYDSVGRITGITYPGGDEVAWLPKTFTYSFVTSAERGIPANHWRRTTATGNAVGITYFDAMLRPVLSDSDIGSSVQTSTLATYDAKGQKIFGSYPSAAALTFTQTPTAAGIQGSTTAYDALGRTIQVQQDSELGTLTSSTAYLSGARQQVTDPKGNVTTTSYQVFDAPRYDAGIQVQAPAGITQTIARDLYGNPLSITQSGLYGTESDSVTKTLTYDSYHRLCRITEPESGSEVMAYDAANNLAWNAQGLAITGTGCGQEQVAAAAQTARTYDAMNRVLTILPPSGTQSTQYHYTPLGQPDSVVSGISTWSGSYNYRGMLTGESLQLVGQNAWGLGYAHDAYGSLSLLHYPDGENVSYAPDALGRPTQAGSYATGIGYFPNGQVSQFAYGNGTAYVAEQNARQMLSNFSYGPGSTAQLSEDLSYDANGNITTVADLTGGPRAKSFGYDALNRLSSANAASLWGTQAYTYDALNNLRTLQSGNQTSTYHYDTTNKLASISSGTTTLTSYVYDNRGNVTGNNAATLVFDQKNQLTQIPGSDAYAYDATGRRVSKTAGGITTYYFYSQAGQLMYQWAPSSALTTSFVYLGSKLVGDNESVSLSTPATISFDANPNNGNYTVSWGAVPGADGYALQESYNGGTWTTVYSNSMPSVAMTGKSGGSYVYQARACAGTTVCTSWVGSATLGVRPALPTVTVPGGTINGTYTVSWTAPVGTTGYDVQERLNSGAWTTIASNTAAMAISRPGTTSGSYTYQVSANNAYGSRGWAGSTAVTVDTTYGVVPTAPASLTVPASSNTGGVTLSWSASNLTTRYVVEQSSNGGTSWTGIYNSSGTSTTLSGLADGSYVFHVQACNTYGCSAWAAGNVTLIVTHPPTTAPTVSVPANSTNGSYTVSWSGVAGQVSYTLQEQVNGGGWTTVQTNGLTSWSTGGRGNGTYGYHVQACNVGGCGPWSAAASTAVLLVPPVPASISVPATSNGPIAISWAASATATIYGLDQSVNGGAWAQVYANSATSTTVTAAASGSYSYRAYACNASGCNGYAVSGAVAVTLPPASAPSLSVPGGNYTGSYTVSWGAVTAATSYTLQEQVNGGGWTTIQSSGATSLALGGKGEGSYGYRVQACNAGGCGPWSSTGTITVTLVPATPGWPSLTGSGALVHATWSGVARATSYTVEDTPSGGMAATFYSGPNTLASGSIYFNGLVSFHVKACNTYGCSAWSAYSYISVSGDMLIATPIDRNTEPTHD